MIGDDLIKFVEALGVLAVLAWLAIWERVYAEPRRERARRDELQQLRDDYIRQAEFLASAYERIIEGKDGGAGD